MLLIERETALAQREEMVEKEGRAFLAMKTKLKETERALHESAAALKKREDDVSEYIKSTSIMIVCSFTILRTYSVGKAREKNQ